MMKTSQNLQEMICRRIPGDSPGIVVGREKNLDKHFEKIQREFVGAPELCFHFAKLIVLIRRRIDVDKNVAEFFLIVEDHIGLLCEHLSTRWLIAICDTFIDHGSPIQKPSALAIVVLVNSIKLAESERLLETRNPEHSDVDSYLERWPHECWDGVTSYHVVSGDMPRNMIRRIEETLEPTPALAAIFATVKKRLQNGDNLFARLSGLNRTGFWEKRNQIAT